MTTGIIDLVHASQHPAPLEHPENPTRITRALEYVLNSDISSKLTIINPPFPRADIIEQVIDGNYLGEIKKLSLSGGGYLDFGDTYVMPGSFDAAVETASAAAGAAELIMDGDYKSVFLAGRPPGHHAGRNRGTGFCLINNAAVAAEALIQKRHLKRVAIVDWDVHHGNGTQDIFYERADVLYISLHQYPFYPGSGTSDERGRGAGQGYTINFPLSAGTDEETYMKIFMNDVIPSLKKYNPEFIIISAGFDAHRNDPLGGLRLTEQAYGEMTLRLREVAEISAQGRILSVFEGGYNPSANGLSLYEHLKELSGNDE